MSNSKMSCAERLRRNQDVIQTLYTDILGINPIDGILNFMYQHGIISVDCLDKIQSQSTVQKRCYQLFRKLIKTKKVAALEKFHDAIQEQYPYIAEKITREIDFKQLERKLSQMDSEDMNRLIALVVEQLHCAGTVGCKESTSEGGCSARCSRTSEAGSYCPDTCCAESQNGAVSTYPDDSRRQAMKRAYSGGEYSEAGLPRDKIARVDSNLTAAEVRSKTTIFSTLKKTVGDVIPKKKKLATPKKRSTYSSATREVFEPQRRDVMKKLTLEKMRSAMRCHDAGELGAALQALEAFETSEDREEIQDAKAILQSIKENRDLLQQARSNGVNVNELRRIADHVSQSSVAAFLQRDLDYVKQLLVSLDSSPCCRVPPGDARPLDKNAIREILSCPNPPTTMKTVMKTVLLLLGGKEKQLEDWKYIQKQRKGLHEQIMKFKLDKVTALTARRVQSLLAGINDQDVQTTSAALYPFYVWTTSTLNELQ